MLLGSLARVADENEAVLAGIPHYGSIAKYTRRTSQTPEGHRRLIDWLAGANRRLLCLACSLVARVTVGWVFLWSGWGKLNNLPIVIDNFVGWSIPFPKILAPFVSGVEYIGGILLLLGLFTRMAAVPLVSRSSVRNGMRSTR